MSNQSTFDVERDIMPAGLARSDGSVCRSTISIHVADVSCRRVSSSICKSLTDAVSRCQAPAPRKLETVQRFLPYPPFNALIVAVEVSKSTSRDMFSDVPYARALSRFSLQVYAWIQVG